MSIIIGGPPSSGSSLLSVLLNRHSDIYIEQESHMLSKAGLYHNWNRKKKAIYSDSYTYLPSPGWHMLNGVVMSEVDEEVKFALSQTVKTSHDLKSFISSYSKHKVLHHDKKIWGEKTPSNIYFFNKIMSILPESTFISTIRNPYDIIASLINRGLTTFSAFGLCLSQLYMTYAQQRDIAVYFVKYEDLVKEPEKSLNSLFKHLDVKVENVQINSKDEVKIKGWNYHEDGDIGTKSINRFQKLPQRIKDDIISLADQFIVDPRFINQFISARDINADTLNLKYLAKHFGYENPVALSKSKYHYQIKYSLDRAKRLFKLHPTFITYPIKRK